jgi:hypothetical protein
VRASGYAPPPRQTGLLRTTELELNLMGTFSE